MADLPIGREVIEPHDDVTSGHLEMTRHAAELHQAWHGAAVAERGNPRSLPSDHRHRELGQVITSPSASPVRAAITGEGPGHLRRCKKEALIVPYHVDGVERVADLSKQKSLPIGRELQVPGARVRRAVLVGPTCAGTRCPQARWGPRPHQFGRIYMIDR